MRRNLVTEQQLWDFLAWGILPHADSVSIEDTLTGKHIIFE